MVLALLKNVLFPSSSRGDRRFAHYGTMKELLTDAGEVESTAPGSPTTLSQAEADIEARQQPPYDGENCRGWKLNPRIISDAIIGLSDGLTVPFALTAGLSGLGDTKVVVLGGLAELFAGAISMGLGGFIGAKSEAESYKATLNSTRALIQTSPSETQAMVEKTFKPYGLTTSSTLVISKTLHDSPDELLDFLMRFHHQEAAPATSRPVVSAATIAGGYFVGGFVPLLPYFCVDRSEVLLALWWSIAVMIVALFSFGWVKTGVVCGWSGRSKMWAAATGGAQMVIVGGVAAGAAVGLVRAINGS